MKMNLNNKIFLLHTTHKIIDYFERLVKTNLPDSSLYHLLDETILEDITTGDMDRASRKLRSLLDSTEEASRVVVTCTSTGELIDTLPLEIQKRITRIERPALNTILKRYKKPGIVFTNKTVWKQFQRILKQMKTNENMFAPLYVPNAFNEMLKGNFKLHDIMIDKYLRSNTGTYDSYLLAQVSICSATDRGYLKDLSIPVINISEACIKELKKLQK
ncbi:hypothetical protein GF389_00890 [Candidatus Dojkabacteria bacterium]|nr:hypothetical protein [Candidatus Dojkabacteria bacterium]